MGMERREESVVQALDTAQYIWKNSFGLTTAPLIDEVMAERLLQYMFIQFVLYEHVMNFPEH